MSEQPNTAAGSALMDAFVSDAEARLERGGQLLDWDGMRRRILAIEAEARQQDGSALRKALEAALGEIEWWKYFGGYHGWKRYAERAAERPSPYAEPWTEALAQDLAKFTLRVLAALPPSAPAVLDVGLLTRAMEVAWPGWLEEAPGTDEARAEVREYAATIAAEYARLQEQDEVSHPVSHATAATADQSGPERSGGEENRA